MHNIIIIIIIKIIIMWLCQSLTYIHITLMSCRHAISNRRTVKLITGREYNALHKFVMVLYTRSSLYNIIYVLC